MIITLQHQAQTYKANLKKPIDLTIPLIEGKNNVNCYYAEAFEQTQIDFPEVGFVGSVAGGGCVNYTRLHLTPHGNGTHTECVGHILAQKFTIMESLHDFFFMAQLISVEPQIIENGDSVIFLEQIQDIINFEIEAIIIRTLPNQEDKKNKQYSNTNPPYLDWRIGEFLKNKQIKHLLLDLPSVDRESDGGELLMHKAFWGYPQNLRLDATITELIYVPNELLDGLYLLNLQALRIAADASPSRVVLFGLEKQM